MIPLATRSTEHLALFGLGASGRAAARALAAGGALVSAWDADPAARARAAADGVVLADIAGAPDSDWRRFSALVLAPGVPLDHPAPHPVVRRARRAGVAVVGDIELLAEACSRAVLVGVTGTNGKSTTAALLHHVLAHGGRRAQVGGNLGPPALGLDPPEAGDVVVLEISSYQLDLTVAAAFDVAVLLNVTADHLDRHGGVDGYVAAKKRIFRTSASRAGQVAVVGADDPRCRAALNEVRGRPGWRVRAVSVESALADGVRVRDGRLVDSADGAGCDLAGIDALRGPHNWQNAAASWAASRALGMAPGAIASAFATWTGLPHRMETVARAGGVRYVNDSKATNGEAAARALASFRDVYWIAGGVAKEDGLAPADPWLGRVRHAWLIGEAAPAFARHLEGRAPATVAGDLDAAFAAARARAEGDGAPSPVVLLSPACASFDQYRNFEARGEHFRALARVAAGEGAP